MSTNPYDAIKAKIEEMTDEQRQRLTQEMFDDVSDIVKAVKDKLPYVILEHEASRARRTAQAIMKGGKE